MGRPITEGTAIIGAPGSIVNAGSLVGTGVDWASAYEPYGSATWNAGVITAAGSVTLNLQQSNYTDAGSYVTFGSLSFAGAAAGTAAYAIDFDPTTFTQRYIRQTANVAAGSANLSATLYGKARTITS